MVFVMTYSVNCPKCKAIFADLLKLAGFARRFYPYLIHVGSIPSRAWQMTLSGTTYSPSEGMRRYFPEFFAHGRLLTVKAAYFTEGQKRVSMFDVHPVTLNHVIRTVFGELVLPSFLPSYHDYYTNFIEGVKVLRERLQRVRQQE